MTQFNFGTIVATTKSGSGLAADLNAWRDAIHSGHKGPAIPSYKVAGLGWIDDHNIPWEDYVYDGAANALRGFIDPSTHRYSTAGNYAKTITSGGVTAKLSDWGTLFNMSGAAAQTVAIQPKSTLLAGWWIRVIAQNITVTINPSSTETIDGQSTLILSPGSSVTVFYDGANFWTDQTGSGASAFPVGGIIYIPATAPPQGFIRLNGALLSRATYPGLWGFAQTSSNIAATDAAWTEGKFSPGDGSTNFRIPDGRGNFFRAWDNSRNVDAGRTLGSSQGDAFESHSHTASSNTGGSHSHTASGGTTSTQSAHSHTIPAWNLPNTQSSLNPGANIVKSSDATVAANATSGTGGAHSHTIVADSIVISTHSGHTHTVTVAASTPASTETRPRNVAMLACIKI